MTISPLELLTENVTAVPATGAPASSVTRTTNGWVNLTGNDGTAAN